MSSLFAAFVLTGGRSTRMRSDKALLPWPDSQSPTLVEHVAATALKAAGSATLVGEPARYRHLNLPVIPDLNPGLGPLSGVEAALTHTTAEWNLIVACDLPNLDSEFLANLMNCEGPTVAVLEDRPALCAVLHRENLKEVRRAIAAGELAWHRLMDAIDADRVPADPQMLANINSPKDLVVHE